MRKISVLLLSLFVLINISYAQNPQNDSPVEAIQSAITKLNQLSQAQHSHQGIRLLLEEEIAPLFDFNFIASAVLWPTQTDPDKNTIDFFANKLKQDVLLTLLSKLSETNNSSFQFVSARPMMNGNIIVQLKVGGYSPFGFTVLVDLLFHRGDYQKWQIFDVVLNNDSLVSYYQKLVLIKLRRYGFYRMLNEI